MIACLLDRMIFQRISPAYLTYSKLKNNEISLDIRERISLQGWRIENKRAKGPIGLYFGGNAEDVSQSIESLANLGFRTVYSFNYRGYGLSGGKPTQAALYDDSLRIYEYIEKMNHWICQET